jgi:uncharacterized protein (TIGR03118 family)
VAAANHRATVSSNPAGAEPAAKGDHMKSLNPHHVGGAFARPRLAAVIAIGLGTPVAAVAEDGPPQHYQQTNLVSDTAGLAPVTDPHLVNPWGLSRSSTSPWWVSDNGTGLSTLYNGSGAIQSLVVTIPNVAGATDPAAPTGTVFNGSAADFLIGGQAARFLFATENGTIAGWSAGTTATLVVNNAGNAVYKGLALASANGANRLYAANFQAGTVDVFDRAFAPVTLTAGAFHDAQLPPDYAPFNVQALNSMLVVTFAQRESGSIDEVHGPGRGYVDVFATDGTLQKRLQWGTWMNAPWGVAMAPSNFGGFSGMLLVGQFGSGKIAAFDPASGEFRGMMRGAHGQAVQIDGLWALAFGNGANAGPTTTLFFTAGIDDEAHGLFGTLTPAAEKQGDDEETDGDGGHGG